MEIATCSMLLLALAASGAALEAGSTQSPAQETAAAGQAQPAQEPPRKKDDPSKPTTHLPEPPPAPATEEGVIPKSIRIPGTNLSLKIGGYAKVDFIQDFSAIGNAFDFQTNSIPVEGTEQAAESGRTTIHARETRFNLDLRSSGAAAQDRFRVFVEGDFYGTGNAFRLRHAYGEFRGFLGGQNWSTFQDITARPLTIDFEGPDGEVFVRQAMIRYTHALTPNWHWAVAVESPTPQFAVPSGMDGVAQSNVPDIPAFVRYQTRRGHFQLAGILRQIRFDGGQGVENLSSMGGGINATFSVKTFGQDELLGMFATGNAIARYIESLSGQNVDAVLTASGDLSTLRSRAFTLGYIRHWTRELKSGIAYSMSDVESEPIENGSTLDGTDDFRANLIWTPYALIDFGGELLWGRRENVDGSRGDAWRLQFAFIYHLN